MVLLHGWMDCSETWQFLVDCLPDHWSCVALDWRGFGGSERPQEGYWFPDYYADLEALLDIVSPGKPARVIAHSMGGNVATHVRRRRGRGVTSGSPISKGLACAAARPKRPQGATPSGWTS